MRPSFRSSTFLATVFLLVFPAADGFARQTFAPSGRNLMAPEELAYLDRFVGKWEVRTIGQDESTPPHGRMEAHYILDGTMLQADYRGLNPQGQVTFHGTSLRTWDPVAKIYTMKWAMSFSKGFTIIEAKTTDEGELVSTGWGEDGGGKFMERYRFFDFQEGGFKFEMDRSYDDGGSWNRFAYNQYRRIQE